MRRECCPPLPQKEGTKEGSGDGSDVDGDGVGGDVVLHGFSSFLYIGCKRAFHESKVGITAFDGEGDTIISNK